MIEAITMPHTLTEAFSAQVRRSPKASAIVDEHRELTYEELDRLSDEIAHSFPEHSGFIGLVMDHGVEMIASLWAILKSGAAYIPAEPHFPPKRIHYMMSQSGASFVVTQRKYERLFADLPCIYIEQGCKVIEASSSSFISRHTVTQNSLAYVLYTSGTTGHPKGVAVEHRNVCHYVRAYKKEFTPTPDDVMLQNSVCSFDIFVEEVFTPLLTGGALAIPKAKTRADISLLMQFVENKRVSIISGFPYLFWEINKFEDLPKRVRLLISGGDILKASYVTNLLEKAEVYNTYGPTETTVCATYFKCNGYAPLKDHTYPIGKAILETSVSLLDEHLNPVKPGEPGEICIAGQGVSRGYLYNKGNGDPFIIQEDGQRLYCSGDIGYELPDGNIAFLMRKDEQVMIWGKRVEPKEVEFTLEQNDTIEHAVVIPRGNEKGLTYLTAYVVASSNDQIKQRLEISKLRTFLEQHLPDYMIPDFFVQLEDIPLTLNGKVDKQALPLVLKES